MFTIRRIAFRALPVLLILFAAFVVLGEALHLADSSVAAAQEQVAEAGVELCVVTAAAALLGASVGRARKPALLRLPLRELTNRPARLSLSLREPPLPGVPIMLLLQVIRT